MNLKLKRVGDKQRRIKKNLEFKGFSLLSGEDALMVCKPAPANSGINFIVKGKKVPALIDYIQPAEVHTTILSKNGVKVVTVEHLMAAIWGLGIDNLNIELDSEVVPAQDGSAEAFTKALLEVGVIEQGEGRQVIVFEGETEFRQPEFENRLAKFEPHDGGLKIVSTAPWPGPIGKHTIEFEDKQQSFAKDISWARTFLRSPIDLDNLAKWNGIRSVFKALPEDPHKSPIITFTETEFLTPLKKEDEPARHKVLDFIGDLALVGYRIYGKCTINEPGHRFTHQIAQEIRKAVVDKKNDKA
jgi:UDP-3-O-[3-hydroxymyristoyl] N-acetylglucosamine deacetylase